MFHEFNTEPQSSISFAKSTGEADSVCAVSIKFITSRFSVLDLSKSRVFGQAGYCTECMDLIDGDSRLKWCLTVEVGPRAPSCIDWNGISLSINSSVYFEYSLGMTVDFHQPFCSWLFEGIVKIPLQYWYFYETEKRQFILRWLLLCFITDYRRYIVIQTSQYFMFFKICFLCSIFGDLK